MRTTSDLSEQELGAVLRVMRLAEDVRGRALRVRRGVADVTVACAQEAPDAAVLEAVRRDHLDGGLAGVRGLGG